MTLLTFTAQQKAILELIDSLENIELEQHQKLQAALTASARAALHRLIQQNTTLAEQNAELVRTIEEAGRDLAFIRAKALDPTDRLLLAPLEEKLGALRAEEANLNTPSIQTEANEMTAIPKDPQRALGFFP